MYCHKCGTQLPDDAVFCIKCGAKISNSFNQETSLTNSDNDSLDKKAVEIYLGNVRSFEYIINKQKRQISELNNRMRQINTAQYVKGYKCKDPDYKRTLERHLFFLYDSPSDDIYLAGWRSQHSNYWTPVLKGFHVKPNSSFLLDYISIEKNTFLLNDRKYWNHHTGIFAESIFKRKSMLDAWLNFVNCSYEDFKANCKNDLKRQIENHNALSIKQSGISEEMKKFNGLLDKMYSLNIIPDPFRNIYAVHYLYNYISTSNQTLENAMLHCDLEQIKQKLDKIIQQNEEIIINQSILMSQNQKIIQDNQSYLSKLSSIEKNTAKTADSAERASIYAEIAASNAEACTYISLANYLK